MGNFAVSLKRLVEKVSLEVIYTPCDLDKISVEIAEVNRPGLFLAGYYDYFDKLRLQIMGLAEMNFLAGLTPEKRRERLDQLFRQQPPAVILCRNEELEPFPEMQELAKQHGVALLRSNETTCTMMGSLISMLNLELAPRITRHGVLVVTNALNKILTNGKTAKNITGTSFSSLLTQYIDKGIPVAVWASINMMQIDNGRQWVVPETGKLFTWKRHEHCLVLVGYDKDYYYMNDPYQSKGLVAYKRSVVEARYATMGSQAVVIQ